MGCQEGQVALVKVSEALEKAQRALDSTNGLIYVTEDYEELVGELNTKPASQFVKGASIMVKTVEVPDLWFASVNKETSVPYTYVSDEQFIADLKLTGTLQIGYYEVCQLEGDKLQMPVADDILIQNGTYTGDSVEDAINELELNKLADAPSDGKQYARKDGTWAEVEAGGGLDFEYKDDSKLVLDTKPKGYFMVEDYNAYAPRVVETSKFTFVAYDNYLGGGLLRTTDKITDLISAKYTKILSGSRGYTLDLRIVNYKDMCVGYIWQNGSGARYFYTDPNTGALNYATFNKDVSSSLWPSSFRHFIEYDGKLIASNMYTGQQYVSITENGTNWVAYPITGIPTFSYMFSNLFVFGEKICCIKPPNNSSGDRDDKIHFYTSTDGHTFREEFSFSNSGGYTSMSYFPIVIDNTLYYGYVNNKKFYYYTCSSDFSTYSTTLANKTIAGDFTYYSTSTNYDRIVKINDEIYALTAIDSSSAKWILVDNTISTSILSLDYYCGSDYINTTTSYVNGIIYLYSINQIKLIQKKGLKYTKDGVNITEILKDDLQIAKIPPLETRMGTAETDINNIKNNYEKEHKLVSYLDYHPVLDSQPTISASNFTSYAINDDNSIMVLCDKSSIYRSTDLSTFTYVNITNSDYYRVTYTNNKFIMYPCFSNDYYFYTSDDGLTWTSVRANYSRQYCDFVYFNGYYFGMLNNNNYIYYSQDLATWSSISISTSYYTLPSMFHLDKKHNTLLMIPRTTRFSTSPYAYVMTIKFSNNVPSSVTSVNNIVLSNSDTQNCFVKPVQVDDDIYILCSKGEIFKITYSNDTYTGSWAGTLQNTVITDALTKLVTDGYYKYILDSPIKLNNMWYFMLHTKHNYNYFGFSSKTIYYGKELYLLDGLEVLSAAIWAGVFAKVNNKIYIFGGGGGTSYPVNYYCIVKEGEPQIFGPDSAGTVNDITSSVKTALNLPAPPTTDGTYVYKVSIVNGVPTYSWVLDE